MWGISYALFVWGLHGPVVDFAGVVFRAKRDSQKVGAGGKSRMMSAGIAYTSP